jgi:prepilin signal peptidase PulO-like enzyme (type II secretory pathway)
MDSTASIGQGAAVTLFSDPWALCAVCVAPVAVIVNARFSKAAALDVAWVSVLRFAFPRPDVGRLLGHALLALLTTGASVLVFDGPLALATAIGGHMLCLLGWIDAETGWLPDRLTLPLIAGGFGAAWLLDSAVVLQSLLGAVAGFAFLWIVTVLYRRLRGREGLGDGDPIFLAAAGAWTGVLNLPSVILIAALVTLAARIVAAARSGARLQAITPVAFGPGLAVGLFAVWLARGLGCA